MRVDHILHFLACWISVTVLTPLLGVDSAVGLTIIAALGKEIVWDWLMKKGTPEFSDMAANLLGVAFAMLWWSAYLLLALWVFWCLYIFMMGIYRAFLQRRLKGLSLVMSSPVLAVAFVLDFLAQMTVFSVLFLDHPRDWLVTNRLRRYMAGPDGWRKRLADYLCHHLLDPFDPTGGHCDSETPQLAEAPK
jgi:hypothetical protein